jgi:hypothetical protein
MAAERTLRKRQAVFLPWSRKSAHAHGNPRGQFHSQMKLHNGND